MTGNFLSLSGAVFTVICVLILAYWFSKLIGKNWAKAASGSNLKVIDQLHVGNDKQILLVKVQEHVYLIGVSAAGIEMLTEVEGEFTDLTEAAAGNADSSFLEILKTQAAMLQKKKRGNK